jgi:hypothetical protein
MIAHRLTLIHPVDPRSAAPGIAARLERIIAGRPDDFSVLLVGVDECGDLAPGRSVELQAGRRPFDFLAVGRTRRSGWVDRDGPRSDRLAFRFAFLRHLGAIRDQACLGRASTELHDAAWAPLARLLGNPVVQVIRTRDTGRAGLARGLEDHLAARLAQRIVADETGARSLREAGASVAAKTEIIDLERSALCDCEAELDIEIQRLYERHRRFYRVSRVEAARPVLA